MPGGVRHGPGRRARRRILQGGAHLPPQAQGDPGRRALPRAARDRAPHALAPAHRRRQEAYERRSGRRPDEWGLDFDEGGFEDDDDDDDDSSNGDLAFDTPGKHDSRPAAERLALVRYTPGQLQAQAFSRSWFCELLVTLCVVIDISIAVADLAEGGVDSDLLDVDSRAMAVTGSILAVYLYETVVRLYGFFGEIRRHPFWLLDMSIIFSSVVVYVLVLSEVLPTYSKTSVTVMRVLRVLRLVVVVRNLRLTDRLRRLVSSQRARYQKDGFDLDLTYVTGTSPRSSCLPRPFGAPCHLDLTNARPAPTVPEARPQRRRRRRCAPIRCAAAAAPLP